MGSAISDPSSCSAQARHGASEPALSCSSGGLRRSAGCARCLSGPGLRAEHGSRPPASLPGARGLLPSSRRRGSSPNPGSGSVCSVRGPRLPANRAWCSLCSCADGEDLSARTSLVSADAPRLARRLSRSCKQAAFCGSRSHLLEEILPDILIPLFGEGLQDLTLPPLELLRHDHTYPHDEVPPLRTILLRPWRSRAPHLELFSVLRTSGQLHLHRTAAGPWHFDLRP